MRVIPLVLAAMAMSVTAPAQTRNQAAAAGAAGVSSRLQSQGYKDVHDLRRMPDGKWVGTAIRNGHPVTVTSEPSGTTIAR